MSCPHPPDDLSAYLDGELEPATHATVHEHLRLCDTCRREVGRLRTVAGMVRSLPRVEPDETLAWTAVRLAGEARPRLQCLAALSEASALIDGELAPGEAEAVVGHLSSCSPCYRAFKDIERLAEAMAATPAARVPEGLEDRIVAATLADRRAMLRRWLVQAGPSVAPLARTAVRLAAAAVFLLGLVLGVWTVVAPRGSRPAVVVGAPRPAVAVVRPASAPAAPGEEVEAAAEPAWPARRLVATPGAPRVPAGAGRAPRDAATTLPAPTVRTPAVPPTPRVPRVPTVPAPAADPSLPPAMLAGLPPGLPAPAGGLDQPATSRPGALAAKTTPREDGVAPPTPVRSPETRLADTGPRESYEDVDVRVTRSRPGAPAAAASGLSDEHLRAAEANLAESIRRHHRAQPTAFRLNP